MKLLADVIAAEVAAEARARLAQQWRRYALYDRGSFEHVDDPDLGDILATVAGVASRAVDRPLAVDRARAVRLLAGDYVLVRHDTVHEDRPVEVVVDLSRTVVEGAEVHYRHRGQVFFVVPSRPGAVAVVERGPTVMMNQTYVTKRLRDAEVVRLFALLR